MTALPDIELNDGSVIPAVGFGTFPHHGEDSTEPTLSALRAGYRLLDSALSYENEAQIGEAIRRSGLERDRLVITSKVPGRFQGYEGAFESMARSRADLGLERIDLLLIHWPLPRLDRYVDTWRALVDMQRNGEVRSIGVSNFLPEHIRRLQDATGVTPAVNQIEMHPYVVQAATRAWNEEHGIVIQSWSPLGRGAIGRHGIVLEDPGLRQIAAAHAKSVAQVVLRWHTQLGAVPIPTSRDPARQAENLDLGGFLLGPEEMASITALGRAEWGPDRDPLVWEEF